VQFTKPNIHDNKTTVPVQQQEPLLKSKIKGKVRYLTQAAAVT